MRRRSAVRAVLTILLPAALVSVAPGAGAQTGSGSASNVPMVRQRASISVRMTPVRLFDFVTVRGTVDPAVPGAAVEIVLLRGGHVMERRDVELGPAGGFSARFRVMGPGVYRARASYSDGEIEGSAPTEADVTPLPALHSGSRSTFVRLLERRLVELHYRLVAVADGVYDFRTADAVVAFHKVQGMPRSYTVGPATWRALADPRPARPRREWDGFHLEVDQSRQVLYTVEDGEVTNVLHVSTGAGGATHDGTFEVFRKLAGFSPNRLYYPSYFDGLRALHGWTEVPTYAASHGCVRIPYWNTTWVYGVADYGTRVVIYH